MISPVYRALGDARQPSSDTIRPLPQKSSPLGRIPPDVLSLFAGVGTSVNFRLDKSESHARLLGKASQVWPVGQAETLFKGSAQSLRRSRYQVSGVRGGIQDMDSDPTLLLMKPVRQGPRQGI